MKFFFILVCSLSFTTISLAQGQEGKLVSLKKYAGTDSYTEVLNNPTVKLQLTKLLGRNKARLDEYLDVKGSINLVNDDLVMEGCLSHACDTKSVIIVIELFNGVVSAAIFDSPVVHIYSKEKNYQYLPRRMQEWVFLNVASCARGLQFLNQPTSGVVFQ